MPPTALPPNPPPPNPPSPDRLPGDPRTWEALEDLVAGRLDPAEAAAWEMRIARDPALAREAAEVRALARALAEERFYACPDALLARIVAEHAVAPLGLGRRLLGLAAAVLLCVGVLAAWTGGLPSPDTPLAPALSAAQQRLPAPPLAETLLAQAPPVDGSSAPWLAGLAVLLLSAGLVLARRWGSVPLARPAEVR